MLGKKSQFNATSLELHTPFDFELIKYSVIFTVFLYLIVLSLGC